MTYPSEWSHYLHQLHNFINWQTDKINNLETKITDLNKELTDLRNQKPISVDKIEYRFDLLKVEHLNGTLVVGVTPEVARSIDEIATNDCRWVHDSTNKNTDLYRSTAEVIEQYLDSKVPDAIDSVAKLHQVQVEDEYQQLMIRDLKKQMHDRIEHYINHMSDSAAKDESVASILDKVKGDIQTAIEQHIATINFETKED
ncbi:hypothetical protein H8Z60_26195 [Mycolicibacterium fortuitum]|nr:hypothetical protein [Mycolicibacterium fortuitum]